MCSMFNCWLIAPNIFQGNRLVCLLGKLIFVDENEKYALHFMSHTTTLFPNATDTQAGRKDNPKYGVA